MRSTVQQQQILVKWKTQIWIGVDWTTYPRIRASTLLPPYLGIFANQLHSKSKSPGGGRRNEVYHTWALPLGYSSRLLAQGWNSSIMRNDQNIFHFLELPCGPEKIQYMSMILISFAAQKLLLNAKKTIKSTLPVLFLSDPSLIIGYACH